MGGCAQTEQLGGCAQTEKNRSPITGQGIAGGPSMPGMLPSWLAKIGTRQMIHFFVHDHELPLVLLSLVLCVVGTLVTVRLWRIARDTTDALRTRLEWCFLAGVTGGASIWATHFIAMLGHQHAGVAGFDPALTILSVVVAILGLAVSFALATSTASHLALVLGGTGIGLSIAAMHYMGMAAYEVPGEVTWNLPIVVLSIVLCVAISIAAAAAMRDLKKRLKIPVAVGALVAATVALHFTGMAAFSVPHTHPMAGPQGSDQRDAIALGVVLCALIVIGMGFCGGAISSRGRARSERALRRQALIDPLTELPNRRKFHQHLKERFHGQDKGFAMLSVDLDRFKTINDTMGHPFGDKLLQRVGGRLKSLLGDQAFCARLGGDEFAILIDRQGSLEDLKTTAKLIIEIISRSYVINAQVADIGASIGIAVAPEHGHDPDTLVQNADIALYGAKDAGRGRVCVFEDGMVTAAQSRKSLEIDLRRALARKEFELCFQPLYDPQSSDYNGAEALLRWRHHERGVVSPADFIPLAEELGLIVPIGEWVLEEACREAASWPSHMRVAVNVSAVQMMSGKFRKTVFDTLARTGLPPERLELEITETTLLCDDVAIFDMLTAFRAAGISIALDDFGTGYSSLTSLHRYPINRIKIDRSFIGRSDSDESARNIVRAITNLADVLSLNVTAEGIERTSQSDFVQQCGRLSIQGYLYGRPGSIGELPASFQPESPKNGIAA